jgi:hypothetical protein
LAKLDENQKNVAICERAVEKSAYKFEDLKMRLQSHRNRRVFPVASEDRDRVNASSKQMESELQQRCVDARLDLAKAQAKLEEAQAKAQLHMAPVHPHAAPPPALPADAGADEHDGVPTQPPAQKSPASNAPIVEDDGEEEEEEDEEEGAGGAIFGDGKRLSVGVDYECVAQLGATPTSASAEDTK